MKYWKSFFFTQKKKRLGRKEIKTRKMLTSLYHFGRDFPNFTFQTRDFHTACALHTVATKSSRTSNFVLSLEKFRQNCGLRRFRFIQVISRQLKLSKAVIKRVRWVFLFFSFLTNNMLFFVAQPSRLITACRLDDSVAVRFYSRVLLLNSRNSVEQN